RISVRNPDIIGLAAIEHIAEYPTAGGTLRIHPPPAIVAIHTLSHAGYGDFITLFELAHGSADFLYNSAKLVADDSARSNFRHSAMADVFGGSAGCGSGDFDNSIGGLGDAWLGFLVQTHILGT